MGLSSLFYSGQPHNEASAGHYRLRGSRSQEVEHGHCHDIRKAFCTPPNDQA
jgi:hypothetical protein